ncbi:chemotaxis protein CheB [Scytonema sp. UIC 10036]|uniref:chemotaxis protein CheB n=1 Tax=Scytonema sp. UIC 10036 TaxID=2304196 RepID=UPI001FA9B590|nr:chemotaxis protein CheB [Scytonema sp. UIC 10036]
MAYSDRSQSDGTQDWQELDREVAKHVVEEPSTAYCATMPKALSQLRCDKILHLADICPFLVKFVYLT